MKKWTRKNTIRELLEIVKSQDTAIVFEALNHKVESAHCTWRGERLSISIDPFQCSTLSGVVHEALHFLLRKTHHDLMDYDVEEPQIQALEEDLVKYIRAHTSIYRSWKSTINRKLGGKQ